MYPWGMKLKNFGLVFTLASGVILPITAPAAMAAPTWDKALYWVDEGTSPYSIQSIESQSASPVAHLSWPRPNDDAIATDDTNIFYVTAAGITKVNISTEAATTLVTTANWGTGPTQDWAALTASNGYIYWMDNGGISRANTSTGAVDLDFLTVLNIKNSMSLSYTPLINKIAMNGSSLLIVTSNAWSSPDSFIYTITNNSNPSYSSSGGTLTHFLLLSDPAGLNLGQPPYGVAISAANVFLSTGQIVTIPRSNPATYTATSPDPSGIFAYGMFATGNSLYFATGDTKVNSWDVQNPATSPNYISRSITSSSSYGIVAVTRTPPPSTPTAMPVPEPPQTSTLQTTANFTVPTTGGIITISGNLIASIVNIAINGVNIPQGSWMQDKTMVLVAIPAGIPGPATLTLFNGQIPLLPELKFKYESETKPAPSPSPTVTPTVEPNPEPTKNEEEKNFSLIRKVFFGMNSSKLTSQSTAQLKQLALKIGGKGELTISVTGFVQPTSINSNEKSLSLARAHSVIEALKAAGVEARYVEIAGGNARNNLPSSRYALIEVRKE